MAMKKYFSRWLWYPGDMEIYHCMKQNFSREERGFDWPAYWHMDDWNKSVLFTKTVELPEKTSFTPYANGVGYLEVNGVKHPFGREITCGPGKVALSSLVGNMNGLPALYVEGDVICSDTTWHVTNYPTSPETQSGGEPISPGWSPLYVERAISPDDIPYQETVCAPVAEQEASSAQGNQGVLFDFGRLINGTVKLELPQGKAVTLCYGESDWEALDEQWCYYKEENATPQTTPRRRAFRYLFIPGVMVEEVKLFAVHTYVDIPVKAEFHCDAPLLNRIFEVSVETFRQCSGLFFLDGVKRDRWVWSGDAYQSYVVNPYIFFDPEINKRTLLGLRGNLGRLPHLLAPPLHTVLIDLENLEQDVLLGVHDGQGVLQALGRVVGRVHMDVHPTAGVYPALVASLMGKSTGYRPVVPPEPPAWAVRVQLTPSGE